MAEESRAEDDTHGDVGLGSGATEMAEESRAEVDMMSRATEMAEARSHPGLRRSSSGQSQGAIAPSWGRRSGRLGLDRLLRVQLRHFVRRRGGDAALADEAEDRGDEEDGRDDDGDDDGQPAKNAMV